MPAGLFDTLGMLVGFVLTLFVFSYILGDNALFRVAIHIFVGVTAGYLAFAVFTSAIWPQLLEPVLRFDMARLTTVLVPLILSLLVLTKAFPRLSGLGTPVLAFLVGIGAAAAIGGAVLGTVIPQSNATVNLFDITAIQASGKNPGWELLNGTIILVGTLTTLAYFHFGVRTTSSGWAHRPLGIEWVARVRQVFIAITLGALFAGAYAAALSALVERWQFIYTFILSFIQP